ncbi:hypothetical protein LTR78_007224 [Recurvomyces mirabilis]|uniref:Uncharacterized protein n=1 Tax=Recurvomyces mirabilis TaxID=574656 RepID=A0AAE1BYL4_9PEZI|nr:hypothetical protein LTR78_007224 [Recurvomyces mirabilis]KAK5155533.1 hypothetical protein LTS14_005794 [Recurvomyces mirabilis]
MVKQQSPPPAVLYNLVSNSLQLLRWEDLPLPQGRSLNSCRAAFGELQRSLPQHPPFMPNPYGPQTPLSAPPPGMKRPFTLEPAFPGREIRPKPVNPGAFGMTQLPSSEPSTKRKRGRPTKKEAEEKAAKAQAAGGSEPPGPAPLQIATASTMPGRLATPTTSAILPSEMTRPIQAPTTRMPISAMLTPAPHTASSSSSSSGKRRRGRSTRSDPEGRGGMGSAEQQYESPYARATADLQDTPARAAVMRHREDQQTPITYPGPSGSIESGAGAGEGAAGPSGST